jgi:hypothetical protein
MFPHEMGPEGPAEESARGRGGPGGGRGHRGGPRVPRGFGERGDGPRGRGFGRPGGWQQADLPSADDAAAWFEGRLPSDWFAGSPNVSVDREEIVVTGELAAVDVSKEPAAAEGRLSRFREETRTERVKIAAEAEARYGRKVAWGASIGSNQVLFSHLSIPVMTRLRQPQRQVLDTLVDAGVARSRSEALAWAVDLVGQHTDEWLASLRTAMAEVDKLRATGPDL